MSNGQQHHNEANALSFESINAHVNDIYMDLLTSPIREPLSPDVEVTDCDQEPPTSRMERLVKSYTAARPILIAVAATPFIPGTWSTIVTTFVMMLDDVNETFKAGKDQLLADAPSATMEPKLPTG